jgi:hypothetical protein
MLKRLASTFSTPAATPPRAASPAVPSNPNTHAGRAVEERSLAQALQKQGIPTSQDDCFACDIDCEDDEHDTKYEGYPRGFDVDWDSDLLGSANPAPRNVSNPWVLGQKVRIRS